MKREGKRGEERGGERKVNLFKLGAYSITTLY